MPSTSHFIRRTHIQAPADAVFQWHARPGAFTRLTPPWDAVELVESQGGIDVGARAVIRVPVLGPFRATWVAEHDLREEGRAFRDVQVSGPFSSFQHTHRMIPDGPDACFLEDSIEYALPLGPLGRAFGSGMARSKLERMFAYRHRVTTFDIARHERFRERPRLRVGVTGASGLIGSVLEAFLTTGGHEVVRIKRRSATSWAWDDASIAKLTEGDAPLAIVHLAGENVAEGRWNAARKERIAKSRSEGTRSLCEALARLPRRPEVVVSASAIGYYGDRGDEVLTEESPRGEGFLASVCEAWERATAPVESPGTRVVHARIGVVLSPAGGALAKMRSPFRAGVGGPMGPGTQHMSWIAIDDAVGALHHALMTDTIAGPMNVVAPRAVTANELARTLGRVLGRPAVMRVPALALRAAFGDEMTREALLASARVVPSKLEASGYVFGYPELEGALRHVLGEDEAP